MTVCAQVLSCVQFAAPWTVACWLLCPWDFQGRILEWVAIFIFQITFLTRDEPESIAAPAQAIGFFTIEPPA